MLPVTQSEACALVEGLKAASIAYLADQKVTETWGKLQSFRRIIVTKRKRLVEFQQSCSVRDAEKANEVIKTLEVALDTVPA